MALGIQFEISNLKSLVATAEKNPSSSIILYLGAANLIQRSPVFFGR